MGLLTVIAGYNLALRTTPYESVPSIFWGVQNAVLIQTDIDLLPEAVSTPGLVLIISLAAIHAYLNAGYLPSLILATAPAYALYIFTVPGPVTGVVIPITYGVVFAPLWDAIHILPNTVGYGTIGFLSGLGFYNLYEEVNRYRKVTAGSKRFVPCHLSTKNTEQRSRGIFACAGNGVPVRDSREL